MKRTLPTTMLVAFCVLQFSIVSGCSSLGRGKVVMTQTGQASWYSIRTNGGRRTASGEKLSNGGATAAHRTLPFGTRVRVTNLRNNRSEIVRITDRGPFIRGRIIDVTIGTAKKLDFVNAGVVPAKVEVLR